MWFIFGFITLISFSIYFGYKRLNASWKGRPGRFEGIPYQYRIVTHKKRITAVFVGIYGVPELDFSFKKETFVDRLFKFLGLSVEHQIGCQEFDKAVYIVSDNTRLHTLISSSSAIKESALGIFRLAEKFNCQTKEIRCQSGRLWVRFKTLRGFEESCLSSMYPDVVPRLMAFAAELKQIPPVSSVGWKDPFVIKAAIILAISTGLAMNGMVHLIRLGWTNVPFTVDTRQLWMDSMYWGVVVVAILVAGTLFLLGRTARTHLVLIELIFVGFLGATSTAFSELRDINMELDESTAENYEVKVTGKRVSRSRRSTNYYIYVVDWNNEKPRKSIKVSRWFYNSVPEKSYLLVKQKQGYLQYRWVESLDVKI